MYYKSSHASTCILTDAHSVINVSQTGEQGIKNRLENMMNGENLTISIDCKMPGRAKTRAHARVRVYLAI